MAFPHSVSASSRGLDIVGAHIYIPNPMPPAIPKHPEMRNKTLVAKLTANGTLLEIASRSGTGEALRFQFEKLVMNDVKQQRSIPIETVLRIPKLPGRLTVQGRFGPLLKGRLETTELSGRYKLDGADLAGTGVLNGLLDSQGSFRGVLGSCQVTGNVEADNFEINRVRHPVKLLGTFQTLVNGLNGNIVVRSASVRYSRTNIEATGTIHDGNQTGKTPSITGTSRQARIEDLLTLFTRSEPPALEGRIEFHANIVVPPGQSEFLKRLQLTGAFRIPQARFLPATRRNVNKLSARSRGASSKEEIISRQEVTSSFAAEVATRDGVASLSRAEFRTPGAFAFGGGTLQTYSRSRLT